MTGSIHFNGKDYPIRKLDLGEELGILTVASTTLDRLLMTKVENYVSKEAQYIDEQIFYFISASDFRLSDEKLTQKILASI